MIAIFAGRLLRNAPCTIFGDGTATRDYVYVSDVVRAFAAAGEKAEATGAFNIGTGAETDVNTLYSKLATLAKSKRLALHADSRPGEAQRSLLDARRARDVLGWEPQVDLDTGLAQVYAALQQGDEETA